jgi:hypothetical protein
MEDRICSCCGEVLNSYEIEEGQGKCFICLKGNCELCN